MDSNPIYPAVPTASHNADAYYQSLGLAYRKVSFLAMLSISVLADSNLGYGTLAYFASLPSFIYTSVTSQIVTIGLETPIFLTPSLLTPLHLEGPDVTLIFSKPLDADTLRKFGGKKENRNPSQFKTGVSVYRFSSCTRATLDALAGEEYELLKEATGSHHNTVNYSAARYFFYTSGLVNAIFSSIPLFERSTNQSRPLPGPITVTKRSRPPTEGEMTRRKKRRGAASVSGSVAGSPQGSRAQTPTQDDFSAAELELIKAPVAYVETTTCKETRPSNLPIKIHSPDDVLLALPHFVFPYFNGCIDTEATSIGNGLRRFIPLFGNTRETRLSNMSKLMGAGRAIAATTLGREYTHLLWVLNIALDVHGVVTLTYDQDRYSGALITVPERETTIIIEGVETPAAYGDELLRLLEFVWPTRRYWTIIEELMVKYHDELASDEDENDEAMGGLPEYSRDHVRSVLRVFREKCTPVTDKNDMATLTVSLEGIFGKAQKYWEFTPETLAIVLQAIQDQDELPDEAPCVPNMWVATQTSRVRSLAVFGPLTPTFCGGDLLLKLKNDDYLKVISTEVKVMRKEKLAGKGKKKVEIEVTEMTVPSFAYQPRMLKEGVIWWNTAITTGQVTLATVKGSYPDGSVKISWEDGVSILGQIRDHHLTYQKTKAAPIKVKAVGPKTARAEKKVAINKGLDSLI